MVDICEISMISVDNRLPEQLWVKQVIDEVFKCLFLARKEKIRNFKKVESNANGKPPYPNNGFYTG